MDANINIFEAPSRTESKPSSKQEGKTTADGDFASALSDTNQSPEPAGPSPHHDSAGSTAETRPEETATQSAVHPGPVPANATGKPAAARDNNNGTTPAIHPVASTAALATPSQTAAGNTVELPADTPADPKTTAQTPATPGQDRSSPGTPHQTGHASGSQALSHLPSAVTRIVTDAQNSGRHLSQATSRTPGLEGTAAHASTNPIAMGADVVANEQTKQQTTNTPSEPIALAQQKSAAPSTTSAGPSTTIAPENMARATTSTGNAVPASAENPAQGNPQNISAAQNRSQDPLTAPHAAAMATQAAAKSSNRQNPTGQTVKPAMPTHATPAAPQQGGTTPPASKNPLSASQTPPIGAEQASAQPTETATRPANAAIEGVAPQAHSKTVKNGQAAGAQQSPTQPGQTQGQAAQVTAASHQQPVDIQVQAVRADMSLENFMTMDVDGAPELLTSAGLQERAHNNLPQTTLHLRLAPGQAPVIAPNDLALQIARQVQGGTTRFEIRMDPPEMGRIEVQIDMRSERPVQAHLFVERSETLDLLQRDSRQLERALQNMGIDVDSDSLSFSLRDGDNGTGQNDQQNKAAQTAYQTEGAGQDSDIVIPTDIPTQAYGFQLAATQGVNIQV